MSEETKMPGPLQIAGGYVTAVAVAAATAALILQIEHGNGFLPIFIIGGIYIAIAGFPGFALTVLLARRHGWTGWLPFCVMGGLNALLAIYLVGLFGNGGFGSDGELLQASLRGGVAGGIAYWWAAYHQLRPRGDGAPA